MRAKESGGKQREWKHGQEGAMKEEQERESDLEDGGKEKINKGENVAATPLLLIAAFAAKLVTNSHTKSVPYKDIYSGIYVRRITTFNAMITVTLRTIHAYKDIDTQINKRSESTCRALHII